MRSSALIEDLEDASFAGQFESFLGLSSTDEMVTAVRACWAALRTTDTRRYMEAHELGPAGTAMAALIQPLVAARASGGGLSRTPDGTTLLSATWIQMSAIGLAVGLVIVLNNPFRGQTSIDPEIIGHVLTR